MFTQPCFIRKNTPELRKKLEEFGYEPCHRMTIYPDVYKNIAACNFFGSKYYGVSDNETTRPGDIMDAIKNRGMIDCETNEELFLALAALRDDSDYKQWFIMDYGFQKTWVFSETKQFDTNQPFTIKTYKATVEEIIEHFKDK